MITKNQSFRVEIMEQVLLEACIKEEPTFKKESKKLKPGLWTKKIKTH